MKALVVNPSTYTLHLQDTAMPVPGEGELLIQLKAAAINHHELWSLKEKSLESGFHGIIGSDGAGVVFSAGPGADPSRVGKPVVVNPSINWGEDEEIQGPGYQILGNPRQGTFAEYIAMPQRLVNDMPDHLSFEEAAALPLAALTAYRALFTKGRLQPQQRVLLTGIGGGVALYALQFAMAAGAQVYVTSGDAQKLQKARALGAQGGALYHTDGWAEALQQQAGGFDLIVDSAAGKDFAKLAEVANPKARIVLLGRTAGKIDGLNPGTLFIKQLQILGTLMGSEGEFKAMLDFVSRHQLRPVIDTVFKLEDTEQAFARMAERQQMGKVVLSI
ncbi:MAG: zinc-binding dehydrogenase [Hymenobacteraceae bacterium]|nr:zinc-binding dehydrogenase [Hymenobacteraceae bacterium]